MEEQRVSSSAATGMEFFPARADIYVAAGVAGPDPLSFSVQAFVVRRGREIGLIDTLMRPDHIGEIEATLSQASAAFSDIRYVVITHHHPDHSGNLAEIARRTPHARIVCGAGDMDTIQMATGVTPEAIENGDTVLGLQVIETPGHTAGHISLFDASSSTMILGDLAANEGRLVRAPAQFTEDPAQYERTLRSVAELGFDNALPSHGDPLMHDASAMLLRLAEQHP
jgi:glyoxylase-like metal-dependent hydrolase (beta-lactamase superfamily II)